VCPGNVQVVEQRRRIRRHVDHAELAIRQRRLTDTAVVDDGDSKTVLQRVDLSVPRRVIVA
jgi:hypothetical protein